jgi:hypothetical protein
VILEAYRLFDVEQREIAAPRVGFETVDSRRDRVDRCGGLPLRRLQIVETCGAKPGWPGAMPWLLRVLACCRLLNLPAWRMVAPRLIPPLP